MIHEMKAAVPEEPGDSTSVMAQAATIKTRMTITTSRDKVWDGLLFYEEIGGRPPAHLRLLLPVPIRTEGKVSEVGSETMCWYEDGHLLKRITRVEPGQLYEFEIAEQSVSVGGRMRLSGGGYSLRELPYGTTEVAVETCYSSTRWPRWFWRPLEGMVCHSFHRYLLGSIRRKIEAQ